MPKNIYRQNLHIPHRKQLIGSLISQCYLTQKGLYGNNLRRCKISFGWSGNASYIEYRQPIEDQLIWLTSISPVEESVNIYLGWWCRTQTSVVMMSVKSHITMKSFTPAYHLNLIIYWKLSSTAEASSDWGFLFKLCSTENWYLILWWNSHCLRLYVRKSKEQI